MLDLVDSSKLPKGFLIFDNAGFVYVNPEMFWQICAQDIDPVQAKVMAATQKPTNQYILVEKSGPPAWRQLPTWCQVSENDRIIPLAIQRIFAKQMNATATISIPSSHSSPVSHPNETAQLILHVAEAQSQYIYNLT